MIGTRINEAIRMTRQHHSPYKVDLVSVSAEALFGTQKHKGTITIRFVWSSNGYTMLGGAPDRVPRLATFYYDEWSVDRISDYELGERPKS